MAKRILKGREGSEDKLKLAQVCFIHKKKKQVHKVAGTKKQQRVGVARGEGYCKTNAQKDKIEAAKGKHLKRGENTAANKYSARFS